MKNKFLSPFLSITLVITLGIGTAIFHTVTKADTDTNVTSISGKKCAIITKSMGNPYNLRAAEGFQEIIEEAGGTCIIQHPFNATADSQIPIIQSLISQEVDSIAIAASDARRLSDVLQSAMDSGIKVCTFDSDTDTSSRQTFCNQASSEEIALALMEAVYDICNGEGFYAILSTTPHAAHQTSWVDDMKRLAEANEKYIDLALVDVVYGNDDAEKSASETLALLSQYPDLEVICAPTAAGMAAAAKVLKDENSSVKLTGLGLPSQMAAYLGNSESDPCPYMFLWNPTDLGRLAAYTSIALINETITGEAGEILEAEKSQNSPYTLTPLKTDDSASEIIMDVPFKFTPENINEWAAVY